MKQWTVFIFNWTCLQILKARLKIIELNLQLCFYIIYFITSVKVDFKWHVGANVRILVKLFFLQKRNLSKYKFDGNTRRGHQGLQSHCLQARAAGCTSSGL